MFTCYLLYAVYVRLAYTEVLASFPLCKSTIMAFVSLCQFAVESSLPILVNYIALVNVIVSINNFVNSHKS